MPPAPFWAVTKELNLSRSKKKSVLWRTFFAFAGSVFCLFFYSPVSAQNSFTFADRNEPGFNRDFTALWLAVREQTPTVREIQPSVAEVVDLLGQNETPLLLEVVQLEEIPVSNDQLYGKLSVLGFDNDRLSLRLEYNPRKTKADSSYHLLGLFHELSHLAEYYDCWRSKGTLDLYRSEINAFLLTSRLAEKLKVRPFIAKSFFWQANWASFSPQKKEQQRLRSIESFLEKQKSYRRMEDRQLSFGRN